jgi:hypothetical protein
MTGKYTIYVPDFFVVYKDKTGKKHAEVVEVKPVEDKETITETQLVQEPVIAQVEEEVSTPSEENKIVETLNSILIKVIDKYLPKRTYQEENILTLDEQITLDEVKQLLKTITSGTKYDTDQIVVNPVRGCTNPNAKNYNPLATEDDGSCVFERGTSDGQIPRTSTGGVLITKTWYGWKDGSKVRYLSASGASMQTFNEFDEFKLTYFEDTFKIAEDGDVRDVPKTAIDKSNESNSNTTTGTTTGGGGSGPTLPSNDENVDPSDPNFRPEVAPGLRPRGAEN